MLCKSKGGLISELSKGDFILEVKLTWKDSKILVSDCFKIQRFESISVTLFD